MTTLTLTFGLCAIVFVAIAAHHSNRAANVQTQNNRLHHELFGLQMDNASLAYRLDDAEREVCKLRTSNGYMIRDAATLDEELARLDSENAYLRSRVQYGRAVQFGTMLLMRDKKLATRGEAP